jgi:hypothetical protein
MGTAVDAGAPTLHHYIMVRTQVQLEERQHEALRRIAHRKRVSFAEALRRAVDAGLKHGLEDAPAANGPVALLELAAIGASGLGDLGREHDRYLAEDRRK